MVALADIIQIVVIVVMVALVLMVADTLYMYLKQWLLDTIPIRQKRLRRVRVHDVGPELLAKMRTKKLTTLIFNRKGVFTLKKVEGDDL